MKKLIFLIIVCLLVASFVGAIPCGNFEMQPGFQEDNADNPKGYLCPFIGDGEYILTKNEDARFTLPISGVDGFLDPATGVLSGTTARDASVCENYYGPNTAFTCNLNDCTCTVIRGTQAIGEEYFSNLEGATITQQKDAITLSGVFDRFNEHYKGTATLKKEGTLLSGSVASDAYTASGDNLFISTCSDKKEGNYLDFCNGFELGGKSVTATAEDLSFKVDGGKVYYDFLNAFLDITTDDEGSVLVENGLATQKLRAKNNHFYLVSNGRPKTAVEGTYNNNYFNILPCDEEGCATLIGRCSQLDDTTSTALQEYAENNGLNVNAKLLEKNLQCSPDLKLTIHTKPEYKTALQENLAA